jgi:hypothetical protein
MADMERFDAILFPSDGTLAELNKFLAHRNFSICRTAPNCRQPYD